MMTGRRSIGGVIRIFAWPLSILSTGLRVMASVIDEMGGDPGKSGSRMPQGESLVLAHEGFPFLHHPPLSLLALAGAPPGCDALNLLSNCLFARQCLPSGNDGVAVGWV